jgi:superfamily II DNA or RNA helicase
MTAGSIDTQSSLEPVRVDAATVRAAIAYAWLAARPKLSTTTPPRLGTITLHPHQHTAADRLVRMITSDHGALLADPTGVGKTYVALAVAATLARHPTIVAPASLRPMWRDALARTGLTATIHSIEALSQGTLPRPDTTDLLIVDEAHHFRNPSTHRYVALTHLAAHTPILLLSATPIHNRHRDLRHLLALFLGAHAHSADEATLTRYIVCRDLTNDPHTGKPTVDDPVWLTVPHDESTLHALEALPPPVPPSDGAAAAALVAHSLIRQWASSHGALHNALRRRLERAAALESALEHNRHPTYRDLRSWCLGDGAIQLAFPELLVPPSTNANPKALLDAVRAHADAVRTLITSLTHTHEANPDHHRANRIRDVLANHAGQPVVAFSAYEDTVHAIAHHLKHDTQTQTHPRICALARHGGHVANGTITRHQALARFAPAANNAPPPKPAHRIDLLITTDLLSEGVNLQDAAAIIHLDLPWTPARIEQRIGRVARLGSPHQHIRVYTLAPPASSETLLGVDRRLRHKLHEAGRTFGLAGSILPPSLTTPTPPTPTPAHVATIRATLERWLLPERSEAAPGATATVVASRQGFLAACRIGTTPYLVASIDGAPPTDSPATVAEALPLADGPPTETPEEPASHAEALLALTSWTHHRQAHHHAGLATTATRSRLLRRLANAIHHAPPDRRPIAATLATRARTLASAHLTAGAEAILADLVAADADDMRWLTTVATFAEEHAAARSPHRMETETETEAETEPEIIAVVIFHPPPH